MSLYNMINGVNISTFFLLPMLGKHPDEYPRFRDCFYGEVVNDAKDVDQFGIPVKNPIVMDRRISVYTRVGGGNREEYQEAIKQLQSMPGYVKDYDDDFDSTFATFLFDVPAEFVADYDLIFSGDIMKTSQHYKDTVDKVYPKLKGKLPWHVV